VTGCELEWVCAGGIEVALGDVDASVDAVSDGSELDDVAGCALELLAGLAEDVDEDPPLDSMSGILASTLGSDGLATVLFGGADPIVTTRTAQPPTATAAAHVEISWPIRM